MRKGEKTQQAIIEQAVEVFNQRGFAGTSMTDLTESTGLSKGAIYNHFENKDDLAIQAFDYAVGHVTHLMAQAVRGAPKHAIDRLVAVVRLHTDYLENPLFFNGGCPMLNTAVEADDTHPVLREHAQQAMNEWHLFIVRELERGIERGQVRPEVNSSTTAILILASLEGGIMLSKLHGTSVHINRVVDYLIHYLETTVRAS